MTLATERLGFSENEPHALEIVKPTLSESALLFFLERTLKGLRVVAKKSWILTDDFEAYFTYKGRLFVMETPFVNIWISMLGQPADEDLFREIERQVQRYSFRHSLLTPVALVCYWFVPCNPSNTLMQEHGGAVNRR